jgi:hypothetical protein
MLLINRSDPEGPAETLFQEPYFQLLSDALRDGGVITTQGMIPTPLQLTSSRMPMAPSRHHERSQKGMSKRVPYRRICIHHNPHVHSPHFPANLDILRDKLDSWYAARTQREMFLCRSVRGMRKRRKSCVGIITRRSTLRHSYCQPGYEVP